MQETTIENTTTVNESPPTVYSYFMDKIFPSLVTASISAGIVLVTMFFRLNAVASAVDALEANSVRKDVLTETLQPMKDATIRIETKIDRLIDRELGQ